MLSTSNLSLLSDDEPDGDTQEEGYHDDSGSSCSLDGLAEMASQKTQKMWWTTGAFGPEKSFFSWPRINEVRKNLLVGHRIYHPKKDKSRSRVFLLSMLC